MALLKIPEEDRTLTEAADVTGFLAEHGIEYERTGGAPGLTTESTSDEILSAWAPKIDALKQRARFAGETLPLIRVRVLVKAAQRRRRRGVLFMKVFVQIAGEHSL